MYKQATRLKLRFPTTKGNLTVDDLWDLPLTQLDLVAKDLSRAVKDSAEESFITKPSKVHTSLQVAFDVVKDVIATRLAEIEAKAQAEARAEEARRAKEVLAKRQDGKFEEMSDEELQKLASGQ